MGPGQWDVVAAGAAHAAHAFFVRGTAVRVPLAFVLLQPYVTPKVELADQRQERVDVRVLPVIFRFDKPKGVNLFPGQLVDVYVRRRRPG